MDVSFTLWSLKGVLEKIPFDDPPGENLVDLNFSEIAAPYYIKNSFKVSIIYDDSLPYEACCTIYSPKNVITVVIIMKRQYENNLRSWIGGDESVIDQCCLRRELYCHETCHLVAIIRAYPSDRSSKVREDFLEKIKQKFLKSIKTAQEIKAVPFVSTENMGSSPSFFDKDHFRYANDSVNYFRLYQELMFPYDKMVDAAKALCRDIDRPITYGDVEKETFVSREFFDLFPEKLTAFKELLAEEMNR